jgi:tetratricopeptide (TPR) repeat protein
MLALCLVGVTSSSADVLHLTNGRRIVVDAFWEEGDQVFYTRNGATFGFPRSLLDRAERNQVTPAPTHEQEPVEPSLNILRDESVNRTIEQARESALAGHVAKAQRLYRQVLSVAPELISVRMELAALLIDEGNLRGAQTQFEQAKRRDPNDPKIRELLGDVYSQRGRTALAIREWQKALELSPTAAVLDKLKKALRENDQDIEFDEIRRPHFLIRYDGSVNDDIGQKVAVALEQEYSSLAQEFQHTPTSSIHVTLYTKHEFKEVTHAPSWASAVNDGEIRLPVQGLSQITPRLRSLLRHELTHSFISDRTRGNCPAWFHEGFAQLRSGEAPADLYSTLRKARDSGTLLPLWTLEGSLLRYSEEKAKLAYWQALAATQYLVHRRSPGALVKILDRLAEQETMNDALKKVIGLDYQELQTAWEADLDRFANY